MSINQEIQIESDQETPALPLTPANAEALAALQRALELSQGFTLLFVRCNLPAQRDELIARLGLALEPQGHALRRLDLTHEGSVVAQLLAAASAIPAGGSLHVCGLEALLPAAELQPSALTQLNLARDSLRRLACPVVFWLRDDVMTRLAQGAPDFWAWRSGLYEFAPQPEWVAMTQQRHLGEGTFGWFRLPPAGQQERLLALEGLLADYRLLGEGPIEQQARAEVLLELGQLYYAAGRAPAAGQALAEALSLARQTQNRTLEAQVLQRLGDVQAFRQENDAALDSYRQALALFRAVGDRLGEANVLQSLGDVQAFRQENDAALDSYRQALALFRAVGSRLGEANVLLSLGSLEYKAENIDKATALLSQALELYRLIGDRYSQARALYRLGDCAAQQGNSEQARACYQEASALWLTMGLADLVEQIIAPRLEQLRGGGPASKEPGL